MLYDNMTYKNKLVERSVFSDEISNYTDEFGDEYVGFYEVATILEDISDRVGEIKNKLKQYKKSLDISDVLNLIEDLSNDLDY